MNFQVTKPLSRIFGTGVKLNSFELKVLELGLKNLPDDLASIILLQIEQYNLVQREFGSRAINFYRKSGFWGDVESISPILDLKKNDVPLIKLELKTEKSELIHAVFHAVNGRFFCVTFSTSTEELKHSQIIELVSVTKSWRSAICV